MDMLVLEPENERLQRELNQKGTHVHVTYTILMNMYYLDVEVRLLEVEKQQWLLHQRMSRAKDRQITKLQYAIDQMQGKCKHVKLFTIHLY